MKKIATLAAAMFMAVAPVLAQSHEVDTTDTKGNRVVIEISDAAATRGDTLSVTTYAGKGSTISATENADGSNMVQVQLDPDDAEELQDLLDNFSSSDAFHSIAYSIGLPLLLAFFLCFVLPIVLVIAILVYYYKKRQAKYRMAEKILESGQPLPKEFSDIAPTASNNVNLYNRGVKNVCIGAALTLFLYFLTDELGLACIGLFVVANGVSQILTSRKQKEFIGKSQGSNNASASQADNAGKEDKPKETESKNSDDTERTDNQASADSDAEVIEPEEVK